MNKDNNHQARRAARLAAVQAMYQMELTGGEAEDVAREFIEHRFGREEDMAEAGFPDKEFFEAILRGVPRHQEVIDAAITQCLAANWKLTRVDSILRAILRTATYELVDRKDVPARVVIDEYVEISHAFFQGDEPNFINAALDRIARRKRAPEFGEATPDGELEF
jgi:N utilization substance protein B